MSTSGGEDIYSKNTPGRSTRAHASSVPIPLAQRQAAVATNEIVVTDSDVLSGRGIAIANHSGNLRFRKLVSSHTDENYCTDYKTIEKRAVADKIIAHIHSLNPPGRFLQKAPKSRTTKVEGQWEEMTYDTALKKTVQALRDANREDRTGYATAVTAPEDVKQHRANLERQGLTNRQFAKKAAVEFVAKIRPTPARQERTEAALAIPDPTAALPSSPPDYGSVNSSQWTNSSPEFAGSSLAATAVAYARLPSVTPATASRPAHPSMALFQDDRKLPARESFSHVEGLSSSPSAATGHHVHHSFHDSPRFDDSGEQSFANAFKHTTSGPSSNDHLDVMAARAAAGLDEQQSETVAAHHSLHEHDPHHQDDANDYPRLFHDIDDDVKVSAEHAFEDPKY